MTELIWEGKYKDGQKVAPLRVKLPFQTVETVNESAQERQHTLDLFNNNMPTEWRNRLIWGDKKYVLPALLEEFSSKVDMIYIDPPFNTGADFSAQMEVNGEGFIKEPSIIEQKAYRDTWGKGLESYLQWFYETAVFLNELLSDDGGIYVHLDWHLGHYVKIIMDDVFGRDNFRNEIYCKRIRKNVQEYEAAKRLNVALDIILFYAKSDSHRINRPRSVITLGERWHAFDAPDTRTGMDYEIFGVQPPAGRHWMWEKSRADEAIKQGIIRKNRKTGKPEYKVISENPIITTLWDDIPAYSFEYGYDTEKSEKLLTRTIESSSNKGDLVLDCFSGSGTTAAVAEKLNRRWIACDLGRFAIHTARKRLLSIPNVKPFTVQNLGKYERQLWQAAEFGDKAEITQSSYRRFILNLYNAQPVEGYTWLHGLKFGRMVYVGAVDSPVSPSDVGQIAAEFKRATGTGKDAPARNGIDVLGWDFAFELNEVAKQQAAQANINMRFIRIPREVLEKKAVEQGDIHFFELAALSVDKTQKGHAVTLTLTDFVIPQDDVPEDIRKAVTHWEQWIDYWAVDWNNREDTFHNEWQDYRSGKKRDLQKTISHTYEKPETYIIMVKVIDILGNDTTKTLKVEVH